MITDQRHAHREVDGGRFDLCTLELCNFVAEVIKFGFAVLKKDMFRYIVKTMYLEKSERLNNLELREYMKTNKIFIGLS